MGYKPVLDHDLRMYIDEIRPQMATLHLSEQVASLAQ